MKKMKNLICLMSVVFLVSCGSGNKVNKAAEDSIYKKWELSILDGNKVIEDQPIYLELTEDNKVSGFTGCNRLNGSYVIENKTQIRFNQLASTRMACSPAAMELEQKVLELLNTTDNFTIDKGKLMLNIGRRAPLAVFVEMSDNEIVNKYWKLIKLDGKDVKMSANQEREQYFTLRSDSSVMGFAGCNNFNGQYELISGNKIKFNQNMAMTMRACPDLDIDESAMMQVFALTDNYTITGDTLSLFVGKRAALAVFEAVYF